MAIKVLGIVLIISMVTIKASSTPVFQSTSKSWSDAVTTCQGLGMKLYTIETLQKYNDLTSYLASIGLDFGTSGAPNTQLWLGGDYSSANSRWEWDFPNLWINDPSGYTNWRSFVLPDAANDVDPGSMRCLAMQANHIDYMGWMRYPCGYARPFICETVPPALSFQSGPLSWDNAVTACQGLGMRLYTIETQQKFDELTSYLSSTGLGFGTSGAPNAQLWLGGDYSSANSRWEWDLPNLWTNDPSAFTNWRSFVLPDTANDVDPGSSRCLAMQGNHIDYMGWMKYSCGSPRPFVCEPSPPILSFQSGAKSWSDAVTDCQGLGMKLYTIETQQKFDDLTSYLASIGLGFGTSGAPHTQLWLGGDYSSANSRWEWDSPNLWINDPNAFTNWLSFVLPDAANDVDPGSMRCLAMAAGHIGYKGWVKYPCGYARPFVCEAV